MVSWGVCMEFSSFGSFGTFFEKAESRTLPDKALSTGCFQILYMVSMWETLEVMGLKLHLNNHHVL